MAFPGCGPAELVAEETFAETPEPTPPPTPQLAEGVGDTLHDGISLWFITQM